MNTQQNNSVNIPQNFDTEVAFISGVDSQGRVTEKNGGNTVGGETSNAFKENNSYGVAYKRQYAPGSSVIGTGSGTITYNFNPTANWTANDERIIAGSLGIWAAFANISFTKIEDSTTANFSLGKLPSDDQNWGGATSVSHQIGLVNGKPVQTVGGNIAGNLGNSTVNFFNVRDTNYMGKGNSRAIILHEMGHALGLNHAGTYTSDGQNNNEYYSFKYSLMGGTSPSEWHGLQSQTPMMADIAAIQRLYGKPVNSPLSNGGQVFGFNSNISGFIGEQYNFNINKTPIVTIWDGGKNNTLDLSGYNTDSTISLVPGTFSTASEKGDIQNNIAITFDTLIDRAVGGGGNDTFTLNNYGDTIDGKGGYNTAVFSDNVSDYTISRLSNGDISVVHKSDNVSNILQNIQSLKFSGDTYYNILPLTSPALPSQLETLVSYISGVNAQGKNIAEVFSNKNGARDPDNFNQKNGLGFTKKWDKNNSQGGSSIGSGSGTITYSFKDSAHWSDADKQAFTSSLDVWSSLANVSFKEVSATAEADIKFDRRPGGWSDTAMVWSGTDKVVVGGITTNVIRDATVQAFDPSEKIDYSKNATASAITLYEEGKALGLGLYGSYATIAGSTANSYNSQKYLISTFNQFSGYQDHARPSSTPMMADILAIQRLYGTPVNSPLASGGQVFGFNSNISGSVGERYDFIKNVNPIVTIWDGGRNNTLDLSGFGSSSYVNLNPGEFSSANGLTDNIGIAYGTMIEHAIGGAGNDTFVLNDYGDTIDGKGGNNTAIFSDKASAYSFTKLSDGDISVIHKVDHVSNILKNIQTLKFADNTSFDGNDISKNNSYYSTTLFNGHGEWLNLPLPTQS